MAKPPAKTSIVGKITGFLNEFTGRYTDKQLKPFSSDIYKPRDKLFTDTERTEILKTAMQSDNQSPGSQFDPLNYFGALSKKSIGDTLDNDRIMQMVPEISLAASIMIPSILAPNDMREGIIQIECDVDYIPNPVNSRISDYLTEFFEEHFSLSTTLPKWIEEAMYRSGAKPLMVLPLTTLHDQLTNPDNVITEGSTEAFKSQVLSTESEDVFGFSDSAASDPSAIISTESVQEVNRFITNYVPEKRKKKLASDRTSRAIVNFAKKACSTENLNVIDNPDAVSINILRNKKAKSKIADKVKIRYAPAEYDQIPSISPQDKLYGHPMFMQLPAEAVIPIFTPGTPSDHIGYFIILDDYGHPIDAMDTKNNGLFNNGGADNYINGEQQNDFYTLFQAYGFTQGTMYDQIPEQQVMENIYQQIIEAHLKQRATNTGFSDVGLGQNSAFYRCMFSRFLQQRKTKLLFVPREFIIYFCFKYSQYGTGVSKLEDLKWILSLRISLLVSRMLTAFKNAIDRKLIEINFDEKFAGNALQHMRTAQREAISKDLITFSYNPAGIAQQIAERSYSVKVSGIPGITSYAITKDADQRTASVAPPDTDLAQDIKDMEYLGLEVPPAIMNNLGQQEFSRSVASTNIVFSRKLSVYQDVVCKHGTELVRTFTRYSKILREEIADLIKSPGDDKTEQGTITTDNKGLDKKINDVLNNIRMTLPSPNMAPDATQFENLNNMLQMIDTLASTYMSDDLAGGDDKMGPALASFRAIFKSELARKLILKSGLDDSDFPDIVREYDNTDLLKTRQILMNLATAFEKQKKILRPQDDTDAGGGLGGGAGDMGAGGGFGDDAAGGDTGVDDFSAAGGSDTGDEGGDLGDTGDTGATGDAGTGDEGTDDVTEGPTGQSLV